jgi:tRNA-specific 2-thiouridylase
MNKNTVLVAMSGGVDSSVTAALLKEQGFRVIGITMQLLPLSVDTETREGRCCGVNNIRDAQQIAAELRIPHYVLNLRDQFRRFVIDNFTREYMNGRTPNPCIRCNQYMKFGILLEKADQLGADYIATGHYARIEKEQDGTFRLKRSIDLRKDQSYFLYIMTQQQLKRTLMPLGTYRKDEVRRIAKEMGLHVHKKPESQEICFIEGKDYREFLQARYHELFIPGPILNTEGKIIGEHSGILGYTIGQRRGLGVPSKTPLYVIKIDREKNTLIVGEKKLAYHNELIAEDVNWILHPEEIMRGSSAPFSVTAKVRSIHEPAEAMLFPERGRRVRVIFIHPQWAITPGQAAVFYHGDLLLGGGVIVSGRRIEQIYSTYATIKNGNVIQ